MLHQEIQGRSSRPEVRTDRSQCIVRGRGGREGEERGREGETGEDRGREGKRGEWRGEEGGEERAKRGGGREIYHFYRQDFTRDPNDVD